MVELLLVTHPGVGPAICQVAAHIMGQDTIPVPCIEIGDQPTDQAIRTWISGLTAGGLILTDLYGSTPHRVACRALTAADPVQVLAGLNLAMLLRSLNYADATDSATLYDLAQSGARRGIQ